MHFVCQHLGVFDYNRNFMHFLYQGTQHITERKRNFMHLAYDNVSTKFAGSRTSNSYNSVTSDSLIMSGGVQLPLKRWKSPTNSVILKARIRKEPSRDGGSRRM